MPKDLAKKQTQGCSSFSRCRGAEAERFMRGMLASDWYSKAVTSRAIATTHLMWCRKRSAAGTAAAVQKQAAMRGFNSC